MLARPMAETSDRHRRLRKVRDDVESLFVVVVVALTMRAFLVEAFVIPTGSMAPRLMGEHYEMQCPSCNYEFSFGLIKQITGRSRSSSGAKAARCPTCGYTLNNDTLFREPKGGDRVLVLKYLYRFAEPEPWDVVVFKNPQDNSQNYIKRLIGLPGESIEIVHGDVFFRRGDESSWQIRRKPPAAQQAMWQVVFHNDYRVNEEVYRNAGIDRQAPRWVKAEGADRWDLTAGRGRRFAFAGAPELQQLIFQTPREDYYPHYGYNTPRVVRSEQIDAERDICTDLRLSFTFEPRADDSRVALVLTSFEHAFKGEVHADGTISLSHRSADRPAAAWSEWGRVKHKPLKAGKSYELALDHADFRATLWVNGRAALSTDDTNYPANHAELKRRMAQVADRPIPTPEVRIAAAGGPCELRHLRVMRDVYYTSPSLDRNRDPEWYGPLGKYSRDYARRHGVDLDNHPGWGVMGNAVELADHPENPDLDEFFVLGDNSPQSLDSRAWIKAAPSLRLFDESDRELYKLGTVPRYNLIGKAFFVYWPSGFGVPGLPRLPLVPNVGRMRLIR